MVSLLLRVDIGFEYHSIDLPSLAVLSFGSVNAVSMCFVYVQDLKLQSMVCKQSIKRSS